jgi:hypothetical protein
MLAAIFAHTDLVATRLLAICLPFVGHKETGAAWTLTAPQLTLYGSEYVTDFMLHCIF